MKIIIAGAGEVGTYLAKLLSQENQDIVFMDPDEDKLDMPPGIEIMTAVGDPTSINDLKAAGVKRADIFIAVTPEESVNMTASMLATNLGAQTTIARVSNTEYLLPKNMEFFSKVGIGSIICPEILATAEIVNALKNPWSLQWSELAGGKLILAGTKIRDDAFIINKHLYDLSEGKKFFHIVAIKRGNDTIIPRGSDQIFSGDIVFFSTTPGHVSDIKTLAGKANNNISRIIIMGGSRIAMKVCENLSDNISIKLIEMDREKSYRLAEKVRSNVMVINGDGRNTELLVQENIKEYDAFIALTSNSEANILACVTAKSLGVSKTIAEVENVDYIQMAEKLDIDTIINKKLITASHIYRFLLNADVSTVKSMTFANAEVAELVARPKSKITRKPIKELNLPRDMTLGGKIRDGVVDIIEGDTQIEAGDHVIVFCLSSAVRKIEDYFN